MNEQTNEAAMNTREMMIQALEGIARTNSKKPAYGWLKLICVNIRNMDACDKGGNARKVYLRYIKENMIDFQRSIAMCNAPC